MGAQPAIVLSFQDEEQRAYMQAHPFLNGPRRAMNLRLLAQLPDAISIRQPASGCEVERLSEEELRLRPEVEGRLRSLLAGAGCRSDEVASALKRLAWKVAGVPADTRSILDIGCGDGLELIFLRAAAPHARISAVDWSDRLKPEIKKLTDTQFQSGNIIGYVEETVEKFDLIFSNHVIEHMYNPDKILELLRARLESDGIMLAALPLDGTLASMWNDLDKSGASKSLLDLGGFDLGHPWKTTAADAFETMLAAGFHRVRLIQKQGMINVTFPGEEKELEAIEIRGRRFQCLVFGPLKWVMQRLFGRYPPSSLVKLVYSLERRFWFGCNNLKNTVSPEILLIAHAAKDHCRHQPPPNCGRTGGPIAHSTGVRQ
jgi:SAM-dependent methyltransferase